MSDTRPDIGGLYGSGTYAQRPYASPIQTAYPTRPDCGGMWGSGTWGGRWWAGHIQCGETPPIPPIPPVPPEPDDGFGGGGGRRKKRIIREHDRLIRKRREIEIQRVNEDGDEEDIELILTVWLNLK